MIDIFNEDFSDIVDLLSKLLENNNDKEKILLNISMYYGGTRVYIRDWNIEYRKKEILKLHEQLKDKFPSRNKEYINIVENIKNKISKLNFPDVPINVRIVRHAIEGA